MHFPAFQPCSVPDTCCACMDGVFWILRHQMDRNKNQTKKPVLWTMAGNIDKLMHRIQSSLGNDIFGYVKEYAIKRMDSKKTNSQ